MIIHIKNMHRVGMCSRGTRAFFKRHGLDWTDFLKNGIEAARLEATGDAMALQVTEAARNGR